MQLQEFAKKSQTNFIRNVRPRLLRLFPELYKGKDGNQRLLKDTRYLKISCNGKIPDVKADERDHLQQLIRAGKSKVAQDLGMPDDTDNFLIQEENELARLDRVDDSDVDIHAETTNPVGIKPPATTVPQETFTSNANMSLLHTTMHMPLSTGSMYLPMSKFSTQPHGNLYFNMESPGFIHQYQHLYYPQYQYNSQYQSAFTNINPHVQPNSTFTNTNPHFQSSSTFTNTNPHVQSNSTITNINPHVQSNPTFANTNPYVQSSSTSTNINPHVQPNSTITNINPYVPPNSTFTNTNPHVQSNLTFTKTDPQIESSSTSETNTTLIDLADVVLQQKL